jgi:hypothetical protein
MRAGTAVDSEGPVTARFWNIAPSKTGTKRTRHGSRLRTGGSGNRGRPGRIGCPVPPRVRGPFRPDGVSGGQTSSALAARSYSSGRT